MNVKAVVLAATRPAVRDYIELTKPRLTTFVLIVVFVGGWLAAAGHADLLTLLHAVVGTGLVACGASALNMLVERTSDARMRRTWNRPLPAGRLQPRDVLVFGVVVAVAGVVQLALGTTLLAAALALLNLVTYVAVYTPLKRVTTLNTHVGAIPGAMPALIGWAAVRGTLEPGAWMLFLIVFVWQLPHFLSVAWLYREDYERGGFKMLPILDRDGAATGRQAVLGSLALLPVSLLAVLWGLSGWAYLVGALLLGLLFLRRSIAFALDRSPAAARLLMRASLLYLPLLLVLMLADRIVT
ncbi:MAG: heme o synthase [Planctomycetota bacterium]|jgi:protoheme IX farnesyltransferase